MALSDALPVLEADIVALLEELATAEDPAAARQTYARKLSLAIHSYATAALVQTTGTAAAQSGVLL